MTVRRLAEKQPESFAFTPENLAWAKKEMAKYPEGRQASAVISLLWRAQEQEGWVSEPAIRAVADLLGMANIRVLEVATFYTMFNLEPVGAKAHIQVCGTTPCWLRGANDLKDVCRRRIGAEHHLSANGDFSWEEVECLGACVNAPLVQIGSDTYEDLTAESFEKLIDDIAAGRPLKPGTQIDRQFGAVGGPTTLLDDPAAPAASDTAVVEAVQPKGLDGPATARRTTSSASPASAQDRGDAQRTRHLPLRPDRRLERCRDRLGGRRPEIQGPHRARGLDRPGQILRRRRDRFSGARRARKTDDHARRQGPHLHQSLRPATTAA